MELLEIDASTEDTFYRCLHDEIPSDPRVMKMRRQWRNQYQPKGHRAKILKDDAGQIVGLTNYIPVEYSPYEGENLMAILCMWIHGYDHLVGNQQAKGYGRFMLSEIEKDARRSGCDGMVVWGKDFEAWNPVSFYEHMGYERVDSAGLDVLVWKPFNDRAKKPKLLKPTHLAVNGKSDSNRIQVTNITNGWCGGGCSLCMLVRDASENINDKMDLTQIYAHQKSDMQLYGESFDIVYVEGLPHQQDGPPFTQTEFEKSISDLYRQKNSGQVKYTG